MINILQFKKTFEKASHKFPQRKKDLLNYNLIFLRALEMLVLYSINHIIIE